MACRLLLAIGTCFVFGSEVTTAHTPVDFLEVSTVQPANPIEHGVELKSRLDGGRVETMLAGPHRFARAVGCLGRKVKETKAYMNWYQISNPVSAPRRVLTVLDMVRGNKHRQLTVEQAEYLLTPAQLLTSGQPAPVPDGLDQYKAYRIVDAPKVSIDVAISDSASTKNRRIGNPVFVCIAAEQWHHDEYWSATHPNDCFVVYDLEAADDDASIGVIDQFGLNQLQASQSRWLCARAALLKVESVEK